jgi:hypothetical protein
MDSIRALFYDRLTLNALAPRGAFFCGITWFVLLAGVFPAWGQPPICPNT